MGQTEKNSARAYVFRFAPELGHCRTCSAGLKRANSRLSRRRQIAPIDQPVGTREHGSFGQPRFPKTLNQQLRA
jgi:hypothetical protein